MRHLLALSLLLAACQVPEPATLPFSCPDCPAGLDLGRVEVAQQASGTLRFEGGTGVTARVEPSGVPFQASLAGQEVQVVFAPGRQGHQQAELLLVEGSRPLARVALRGEGLARPCALEVTPPEIQLGKLMPSGPRDLVVHVRNTSPVTCKLNVELAEASPAGAFSLPDPLPATLEAGASQEVKVRYSSVKEGPLRATLVVGLENNRGPVTRQVTIGGQALPLCLLVSPDALDFREVEPGCSSREHTITAYNLCPTPQTLVSASSSGDRFSLIAPALPLTLASGASTSLKATFQPTGLPAVAGEVWLETQDGQRYQIRLRGQGGLSWTGRQGREREDSYTVNRSWQWDVLLVLDEGPVSPEEALLLDDRVLRGVKALLLPSPRWALGNDVQVAVTTSDAARGGQFLARPGNPAVVHVESPDGPRQLLENLAEGQGHQGSPVRQPLNALTLALSEKNLKETGFLRPQANLAVVVLSRAADESPQSLAQIRAHLAGVKPPRPRGPRVVLMGAIPLTPPPAGNCTHATPGAASSTRLATLMDTVGYGAADICDPAWPSSLVKWGTVGLTGEERRFGLIEPADLSFPLEVWVDGERLPRLASDGAVLWEYLPDRPAVELKRRIAPGSRIRITYRAACP